MNSRINNEYFRKTTLAVTYTSFSKWVTLPPQRTIDNVWRQFWLSRFSYYGLVGRGSSAFKYLRMESKAPPPQPKKYLAANVGSAKVEKP